MKTEITQYQEKPFPGLFTYYFKRIQSNNNLRNRSHFSSHFYPTNKITPKISQLFTNKYSNKQKEGVFEFKSLINFAPKSHQRYRLKSQEKEFSFKSIKKYRLESEYLQCQSAKLKLPMKRLQWKDNKNKIQISNYTPIHTSKSNRYMSRSDYLLQKLQKERSFSQHRILKQETLALLKIQPYKQQALPFKKNRQTYAKKQRSNNTQKVAEKNEIIEVNQDIQGTALQKFIKSRKNVLSKQRNVLKYEQ